MQGSNWIRKGKGKGLFAYVEWAILYFSLARMDRENIGIRYGNLLNSVSPITRGLVMTLLRKAGMYYLCVGLVGLLSGWSIPNVLEILPVLLIFSSLAIYMDARI